MIEEVGHTSSTRVIYLLLVSEMLAAYQVAFTGGCGKFFLAFFPVDCFFVYVAVVVFFRIGSL